MRDIDINCDMGEGFGVYSIGDDAKMLDVVTSANIACGFHAGDPLVMHATIAAAAAKGVHVGAHPSFLDLWGFGRRQIVGERPDDVMKHVIYQIGALRALAESQGHRLRHVKTHGSLGNIAAEDIDLADAVARAIAAVDPTLVFVVMPGMATEQTAERHGLQVMREIYADRAYTDVGNLVSRKVEGSVIHDADAAAERVIQMLSEQAIICLSGKRIPARIDSVCVHGDTHDAVTMAQRLRERLSAAGYRIKTPNA